MKTNVYKYLLLITIFVIPVIPLSGQGVALVLSGGGAKAYSHIGVIKALEESDIPIDYIVGNSMGALIGGLYASGYTADEIEKLLTDSEFLKLTRENSEQKFCFYQVDEPDASIAHFTFDIDRGFNIKVPLNVYDFQMVDFQMMLYFASAYASSEADFDNLMIPFRCIATDIDSSRLVVFRSGNIAKAIRASVTFPFYVRPVAIDSTLYFDGGMYDNFPVDVAKEEFNPYFIIGSKAVNNYESPDPDNAISLIQSMLMTKADFEIDPAHGILIESNTGVGTIFQFENVQQYIDSGYMATLRNIDEIAGNTGRSDKGELETRRSEFKARVPQIDVKQVEFLGMRNKQKSYFEKLYGDNNKYEDSEDFAEFYSCLINNENVVSVYPELAFDSIQNKYTIDLVVKRSQPFRLGVGGYISSSGVNEGFLDLGFNFLGKQSKIINVGAYFGTFYNSISAMGKIEFPNRIPITAKAKFLLSRKNYFSNVRYFLEDQFPAYIISDENYLDLSLGAPISKAGVFQLGISNINASFRYYQDNYFTRTDTTDISNFYFLSPWLSVESNTLNHKMYATSGHHFKLSYGFYMGNEKYTEGSGKTPTPEITRNYNYSTLILNLRNYFGLTDRFAIGLDVNGGYSNKPLQSNFVSSLLMAIPYEPLPVMKSLFLENYRANIFGSAGLILDYNFYKSLNFRVDGFYYVPYEKILKDEINNLAYYSKPFTYNYFSGSARIVYHPPIGVVSASVNYIEKPGSKFGFLLNIGYLIFNKSQLNR